MEKNLLAKIYEPHDIEKKWYAFWESEQLFAAQDQNEQKSFSIVIPPPNVTGVLHMGHALNNTMQDILCRYRRLQGDNVLWMPGTDHAGIATQAVVEKKLATQGLNRHQMGKEKFLEAVWEWRKQYGGTIIKQLKRMGASCDWKRERFTMDEGLSKAVRKVFVKLYQDGLIYRGHYIINWCQRCHTALADLEVEHEEIEGHLWHIFYPYSNGKGGITVATTRPETMLGDTAVAVNPEDDRYQDIDVSLSLPLTDREIPLIRDQYVDLNFGSGGLKVTPAHDPNDFEIGLRHKLPVIKVIGEDGCMLAAAGAYAGLDRFECRRQVVQDLQNKGLLRKIETHQHSVGHCYRCHEIIEPNLSKQWFIRVQPLADKAIAAVKDGRTRIIPENWSKTYFEWMYNIKDWCISRQLWWGHQIPAWTCQDCSHLNVAIDTPEKCSQCGGSHLEQSSDVLDTWFSSALWPFSTMGWPDNTKLLKTFYPTNVLVTGFDILFFWVARMMMMGLYFMDKVPFRDVYVHALVRDEEGRKMSKSLGNVIDPLDVIEEFGTDAFRFTLAAFAAQGRDIKMSNQRVEGYRHFINKIWNAARFALMHLSAEHLEADVKVKSMLDRWILTRLSRVTATVSTALDTYRFNDAASALYQFVWHEFCDWYLEAVKPALYNQSDLDTRNSACRTLYQVLQKTLILLHPFIPFITEEIYSQLPGEDGSVMQAAFPLNKEITPGDSQAEADMNLVIQIVSAIRNIRGEMNISPSLTLDVMVRCEKQSIYKQIEPCRDLIINLAKLKSFKLLTNGNIPHTVATAVVTDAVIYVSMSGVIDFAKECLRLEKEIQKISKKSGGASKKLNNGDFLSKAPEDVIQRVREKHTTLIEKQQKLQANLERVKQMMNDE